jgi:hypothetical protein
MRTIAGSFSLLFLCLFVGPGCTVADNHFLFGDLTERRPRILTGIRRGLAEKLAISYRNAMPAHKYLAYLSPARDCSKYTAY